MACDDQAKAQKEEVESEILEQVGEALSVSVEAIKNFNEENTIHIIKIAMMVRMSMQVMSALPATCIVSALTTRLTKLLNYMRRYLKVKEKRLHWWKNIGSEKVEQMKFF